MHSKIELRDYFAIHLLQANVQSLTKDTVKDMAELAYSYADALIEARNKK